MNTSKGFLKGKKTNNCRQIFYRTLICFGFLVLVTSRIWIINNSILNISSMENESINQTCSTITSLSFPNPNYLIPKTVFWNGGFNDPIGDDATDQGNDITIDNEGNLLVTGYSWGENHDILPLLKFSPTGEVLWNCTIAINGEVDVYIGKRLVTDSLGNSYVCGYSFNSSQPAYIWKISSLGVVQWNTTFQKEGIGARGSNIALDSEENIILVGNSGVYSPDIFICKFSQNGELLWSKILGNNDLNDFAYGLSIDSQDNYYLAGDSLFNEGESNHRKIVSYKFSSEGELLWEQTIDLEGNARVFQTILSVDEKALFIIGDIFRSENGAWDAVICKLVTRTGGLQWSTFWGGELFETAWDIILDNNGNLLVTGDTESYSNGGGDLFVLKIAQKNGELLWNYTWGGVGNDRGCGITYYSTKEGGEHLYITGDTNSFEHSWGDILLLIFDDSDWDGLTDECEKSYGTNPLEEDSDTDGVSDYLEIDRYGSDPLDSDSDDDGWLDGQEALWGTDLLDPNSTPGKRQILIFTITIPGTILLLVGVMLSVRYHKKKKIAVASTNATNESN